MARSARCFPAATRTGTRPRKTSSGPSRRKSISNYVYHRPARPASGRARGETRRQRFPDFASVVSSQSAPAIAKKVRDRARCQRGGLLPNGPSGVAVHSRCRASSASRSLMKIRRVLVYLVHGGLRDPRRDRLLLGARRQATTFVNAEATTEWATSGRRSVGPCLSALERNRRERVPWRRSGPRIVVNGPDTGQRTSPTLSEWGCALPR